MNTKMEMKARGRVLLGSDERGMVMVLTLLVMVILVIAGTVLLTTSLTENQISFNDVAAVQGLYVAEAGLQTALKDLNTGGTGSVSGSAGSGQYTASAADAVPPAGQKRIDAYGYVPNSTSPRAVKRVSVLVYRSSPFQQGGFGDLGFDMGGSGGVADSYDSDIGAYDAATANSNCSLRTNSTLAGYGDMVFNGDTRIKGNITTTGVATGYTPAYVTGTITTAAPPIAPFPVLPLPSIPYTAAADVPITSSHITYNAATGALVVGGGVNLTLSAPPTTYYFSSVTLSGGSTLTLNTNGSHMDMYVSGDFVTGGGGIMNTGQKATELTIYACGDPGSKPHAWTLSGGSNAYFAVYAPDRPVVVGGGGHLTGAIIAKDVDITGGSDFTYDEALARYPGNGKYAVAPRSWTELNP